MGKRYPKSAHNTVIQALQLNSGQFFSIDELQEKIRLSDGFAPKRETIAEAIVQFQKATSDLLQVKTERRTIKRLPTRLFSYPKIQLKNDEHSTGNADC